MTTAPSNRPAIINLAGDAIPLEQHIALAARVQSRRVSIAAIVAPPVSIPVRLMDAIEATEEIVAAPLVSPREYRLIAKLAALLSRAPAQDRNYLAL